MRHDLVIWQPYRVLEIDTVVDVIIFLVYILNITVSFYYVPPLLFYSSFV